jgi:hypothetical protein
LTQAINPIAGETATELAARVLGDSSLFREVLALNPSLSPFTDLSAIAPSENGQIEVLAPLRSELGRLEPALTSVRTGINSALEAGGNLLERASSYAQIAGDLGFEELSAQVNGVIGPADNALSAAQSAVNEYLNADGAITLVEWLIGE